MERSLHIEIISFAASLQWIITVIQVHKLTPFEELEHQFVEFCFHF